MHLPFGVNSKLPSDFLLPISIISYRILRENVKRLAGRAAQVETCEARLANEHLWMPRFIQPLIELRQHHQLASIMATRFIDQFPTAAFVPLWLVFLGGPFRIEIENRFR